MSLKFDRVTSALLQKFKVNGSKVKVTVWGNDVKNSLHYH